MRWRHDTLTPAEAADTWRDALALYAAMTGDDIPGAQVILEHTRCAGCTAIAATRVGIELAGPDDGDRGAYIREVLDMLREPLNA